MAEILPNSPNDVASRGVTNKTLAQFKGLARQVVINIDDNFRPIIMDGLTLGGKSKVVLVDDLSDYVTESTYNSDKAGFETTTHASATYATKSALTSGLADKADSSALASYATKSELSSKANIIHTHAIADIIGLETAYLPISGGTLTGTVNGVTPSTEDNSTKIATTAFVKAVVAQNTDDTASQILQAFQDFADEHGIIVTQLNEEV